MSTLAEQTGRAASLIPGKEARSESAQRALHGLRGRIQARQASQR